MKKYLVAFFCLFALSPSLIFAASLSDSVQKQMNSSGNKAGYVTGKDAKDPRKIIADIIQIMLTFTGTIMLVLIIYGGYNYLSAGGDDEKVSKGKKIISGAVIGLIIVLSAYSIVYFVARRIQNTVQTEKIYDVQESSFSPY